MNLVLGAVYNLEYDALEPFVLSLKQSGYTGRVMFWVSGISEDTCQKLTSQGVRLASCEDAHMFERASVNCLRYLVYRDILRTFPEPISHVMLTDVRDVVFQRDPFSFDLGDGLCVFLEDRIVKDCIINSWWILNAYGGKMWDNMADKPISCSGTSIGSFSQIQVYLDAMVDELERIGGASSRETLGGIDQGIHNYLLHCDRLGQVREFTNEDGPVLTMHYVKDNVVRINSEGLLTNRAGAIANTIHQYDRYPEIVSRLQNRIMGRANV